MSWLKDEEGKYSMARVLLLGQLLVVDTGGLVDGLYGDRFDWPAAWWAIQGGLLIALVAWAAGPRGLQYLGPQVGKVASAVSEAVKKAAGRKTPDHEREDRRWPGSTTRSS